MPEPKNQARKEDNIEYQTDYSGSIFSALANLIEENLSLKDLVAIRIPIIEARNTRVNEGGSHSVTHNFRLVNQGKNNVPEEQVNKTSKQQTINNRGPNKERQSVLRGGPLALELESGAD